MAYVVISDKSLTSSKIKSKNYPVAKLDNVGNLATVTDIKNFLTSTKEKDYAIIDILPDQRTSIINQVLPFRVKFTNIGILGAYANIPGIGLQIIEVNNYIL
jgi:hypothetical protein